MRKLGLESELVLGPPTSRRPTLDSPRFAPMATMDMRHTRVLLMATMALIISWGAFLSARVLGFMGSTAAATMADGVAITGAAGMETVMVSAIAASSAKDANGMMAIDSAEMRVSVVGKASMMEESSTKAATAKAYTEVAPFMVKVDFMEASPMEEVGGNC